MSAPHSQGIGGCQVLYKIVRPDLLLELAAACASKVKAEMLQRMRALLSLYDDHGMVIFIFSLFIQGTRLHMQKLAKWKPAKRSLRTMGFFSRQCLAKCFPQQVLITNKRVKWLSRIYTKAQGHKPSGHVHGPLRDLKSHFITYAPKPRTCIPYFFPFLEE